MRARALSLVFAIGFLAMPASVSAQKPSTAESDSTVDARSLLERIPRSWLTLTSGKTYNRVEGLPVLFGPSYTGSVRGALVNVSALGILRSADWFEWDADNVGHRATLEVQFGARRGFTAGATSFDVVARVERWQLPEPDAGLAAFLVKRDYLDHFGRHGGRLYFSAFTAKDARTEIGFSDERWSSRRARNVFALFHSDDEWRINPTVDEIRMHLFDANVAIDSRNAVHNPWAGWHIDAAYERGTGRRSLDPLVDPIPGSPPVPTRVTYGRAFFDLRKYNRISPASQLNARLVIGGWLHGDPLPLERRLSVGGIGTLPGFDFRRVGIGTDVGQCSSAVNAPAGRPALCERVALGQVEYRQELHSTLIDVFNRNGIRIRGTALYVRPAAVVFADAGRGWLVGPRDGDLRYPSGSFPSPKTFRTDVGVGIDFGMGGLYVAKAVSASKEPANFFIRLRNRF